MTRPKIANNEYYMRRTLQLARKGIGMTSPNPMVGAVIVKDGQIIARGYHKRYGDKHAELNAIENAKGDLRGSTLYCNLEPCCHTDKQTPPCTTPILQSGIGRVVIGTLDPNPTVNGKGIQLLKEHGVDVLVGILEPECRRFNEVYFKYIQTGLPFVTIKYAQTIDGRIATREGQSQWISSTSSLKYAHHLRTINNSMMVGIGTVLQDNPRLTVRLAKGNHPIPIIVDSTLRIPLDARVFQNPSQPIIATTQKANTKKMADIQQLGAKILSLQENFQGQVDLSQLLQQLGREKTSSILVEGGSGIITSLLRERLADKMVVCIAPKLLGIGLEAVGDLGISRLCQAIQLSDMTMTKMGADFILEGRIKE
ncbi:MAG: bifunctional diaminohydroxyphosphoribosylaminopyrimidine deaminase/5-amino-6-(5-phosphoribosylamino)uracil reductase RibD [Chloroflexota bacterium]|nr:bifunctional diaminohydroxyphosphoribosylaminopyrimidine deaminase/5-amino-6-(5-phosphoribosylamino)uracil reductase RibD [Chloroflexota bacterium]